MHDRQGVRREPTQAIQTARPTQPGCRDATARWLSDQHQCEGRAEAYDIVAEELEGVLQLMEDEPHA